MSTEENRQADASSEAPAAEPGAPAIAAPPPETTPEAPVAAAPAPEAPAAAIAEESPAAPAAPPVDPNRDPETFAEMELDTGVMQALEEMGYTAPMEVQTKTFRLVMGGRDVMVQSRTGSGKTAAFGIPFAKGLISGDEKHVQAMCICPTRELALQVAGEISKIGAYKNLTVVPVYGGAPMGRQIEGLKAGAQIVAGTPGRILDHLRRGTLDPSHLKVLVLDECDEMLSMGFQEEIETIVERLPKDRQTMLFSATIPEDIERIGRRHMHDPIKLSLSADYIGVLEIQHAYYLVSGMGRPADLVRIMQYEKPEGALIFCNTRDDTAMVAAYLRSSGYDAEPISGDLGQSDRERVMGRMKQGTLPFLVATDVAARGIDIAELPCVINYTFPESPEVYVHRTGRTGRAGRHGLAISLVSPQELGNFYYLKLAYKIRPEERNLPSELEMRTRREGERYTRLRAECKGDPGDEWRSLARRVWQSADGERLVAELMRRSLEGLAPLTATELASAEAQVRRDERPREERPRVERPRDDRPRDDRPRDDRPRDRDRDRPRDRDRDRPRDRDRDRPRDRDRDRPRDRDRDRERRPERPAAAPAPAATPEASPPEVTPPEVTPPEAAPLAAGEPAVERPAAEAPREARPRDRERPRRGEEPHRDRDRDGRRRDRGGRDRGDKPREAAAAGPGERRPEPVGEPPVVPPGMEFWEAWVEQRTQSSGVPVLPAEGEVATDEGAAAGTDGPDGGEMESRAPAPSEPGTVRLYLNLGRRDGVRSEDVLKILAERSNLAEPPKVQVRNTHTYVSVREEDAERVMASLNGGAWGDRALLCEPARGY
jgi:ATP-dependent RNA helicase DeaD